MEDNVSSKSFRWNSNGILLDQGDEALNGEGGYTWQCHGSSILDEADTWKFVPQANSVINEHDKLTFLALLRHRMSRNHKYAVLFLRKLKLIGARIPFLSTLYSLLSHYRYCRVNALI